MIFRTHLAFGFLIGLLAFNFFNFGNWVLFFLFLFFGIVFPDIDIRKFFSKFLKHRGIFHSLILGIVLSYFIFVFDNGAGAGFFLGFLSHLILDSFTFEGINFFNPLGKLRLKGFIKTGGGVEKIVFYSLVILDFFVVAKLLNSFIS